MGVNNDRLSEINIKLKRIRNFMEKNNYAGVLFLAQHNFSWITGGGDDSIIHGLEEGFVNVLITKDKGFIVTNNIEMPRVFKEECEGLGLEALEYNWTEDNREGLIKDIIDGGRLAADLPDRFGTPEAGRINLLRVPLTDNEVSRYRELAKMCTDAMDETMKAVEPGLSEYEIQGIIGGKLMAGGIYPVVLLVGTDERIFNFRHPMPTEKKLDKYCMVVICAQKRGLILSMTRLVHFGALPDVIKEKYEALHRVDMALITMTRPGKKLSDVFEAGKREYREAGYENEELKHFQGGTGGYLTREQGLSPDSDYVVQEGEIFAHNPSITGTKIEDSILVKGGNYDVLTLSDKWPSKDYEYSGVIIKRPEILIR